MALRERRLPPGECLRGRPCFASVETRPARDRGKGRPGEMRAVAFTFGVEVEETLVHIML